jgi:hypothetical protein
MSNAHYKLNCHITSGHTLFDRLNRWVQGAKGKNVRRVKYRKKYTKVLLDSRKFDEIEADRQFML